MKTPSTFGARLRAARYMAELSTEQMGELLELDAKSYSHYEEDKTFPRHNNLITICKTLDVSADWLLGIETKGETTV